VSVLQIKYLEDGIVRSLVLPLHDGILNAHFLGGLIVLKDGLAMQTEPGVFRAGNGNFDFGVKLHIFVNILGVVCAEPQLAVQRPGKHKGAALGLSVAANGGQILYGIGIQKFDDFVHDGFLLMIITCERFCFPFAGFIISPPCWVVK